MLELHDVHAYYGESHILHGMTLRVDTGTVATLVGRNGVGKTTTLRTIMGIVPARRGCDPSSTGHRSPGCRPTGSPSAASGTSPKSAASSRRSASTKT